MMWHGGNFEITFPLPHIVHRISSVESEIETSHTNLILNYHKTQSEEAILDCKKRVLERI